MNDDLFGERLGAALREHSPHAAAALDLGDVTGRARGIRRRRTATGSAAAAVALLAASPFAATTLAGHDDDPLPPATSPTPSPEPTSLELTSEIVLDKDAPADRGTEADWFIGDAALSDQFPFPAGSQQSLTRLGGRWLVGYQVDGDYSLYSIALGEGTGRLADVAQAVAAATTFDLYDEVAVSDDGDLAAFSTPSGELTLIGEDGRTRVVADLPSPGTPVDLIGDAGCLDDTACELVVSYGDERAPELVSGDGTRKAIDPDATAVTAATGDLVATLEPATSPGEHPCTTVRDRSTLGEVWRSCKVRVDSFSPDGQLVEVVDSDVDGFGPRRFGLAEATTGKQLTWIEVDAEQGFTHDVTWTRQGDLEVLSFTFDDQEWRLHHVALDGTVSQRVEAQSGTDSEPPLFSATLP